MKAEDWIESLPRFDGKHSLSDTRAFLDHMGAPDDRMRIIHVAGTNGKGSVCSYISSILQGAGYSVGVFSSPHLESITERIAVNGVPVPEDEFEGLCSELKNRLDEYGISGKGFVPTYFEFLFLMCILYFDRKKPDFVILETGLGGRLDFTNAVRKPVLCLITRIAKDHMKYLGDTTEKIAAEKAGILKAGVPAVLRLSDDIREVYRKRAEELGISPVEVNPQDIEKAYSGMESRMDEYGKMCIAFSYESRYDDYDVMLSTGAVYQVENAILAINAAEILEYGLLTKGIDRGAIIKGLRSAFWPGRMEEIRPGIYLDGAHNPDGVRAFLSSAQRIGKGRSCSLIYGVSADKAVEEMTGMIAESGLFDRICVVRYEGARSATTDSLLELLDRRGTKDGKHPVITAYGSAGEALETEKKLLNDDGLLFIAGSLYLVGECRAAVCRRDTQ